MRCIAVIEAQRPGLDSILIWDRDSQLVAFAYQDGQITMTRPLNALNVEDATNETLEAFQVNQAQFSKVTDFTSTAVTAQPVGTIRKRW